MNTIVKTNTIMKNMIKDRSHYCQNSKLSESRHHKELCSIFKVKQETDNTYLSAYYHLLMKLGPYIRSYISNI